jgi:formate dehydrogenase (coenzyme F420) beta subunit
MSVSDELRTTARELLQSGRVELFLAWSRGSLPLTASPVFITDPDQADTLLFDVTCGANLSVYFTKDSGQYRNRKVGVAVKGCDARSLVLHMQENQIDRNDVVIVGIPCNGVIDRKKALKITGGREILHLTESGDEVVLEGDGFSVTAARNDILATSCLTCSHPDATECDVFLGRAEERADNDLEDRVRELEEMTPEQRWDFFREEYDRCIRCYACRNVCPACYCSECFVDQNDPHWIGNTCDVTDTLIFHIIRNLHVAGRCVECGACARACPVDIDLMLLNGKAAKEIRQRFGVSAGLDPESRPPMAEFREDEKQDFIMG